MPKKENITRLFLIAALAIVVACQSNTAEARHDEPGAVPSSKAEQKFPEIESEKIRKVLESAVDQTRKTKTYDPAYVVLKYPNGDVPIETGVCTDVVIRAFRNAGVDLQKEVHEDMTANFKVYPKKWGLKKADSNIDHRRVPNLNTFFTRKGKNLPITNQASNFKPGDVVSWDLDGKGLSHIGLVSNIWDPSTKRYLIIHNIGSGTRAEDRLFEWKITGHFRYF
jgi:uncharacterized protein YijF (DUF1287 family)